MKKHVLVGVAVLLCGVWLQSQQAPSVKTESESGLQTVELDTVNGKVLVNLPDDMAAGDTISGTVSSEPAGRDPQEMAKNQDELSGIVVEIADKKTTPKDGEQKWTLPPDAPEKLAVVIRDKNGKELGRGEVPVAKQAPAPTGGVALPALGQGGHPAEIAGQFDGDAANSEVKIGGKPVRVLAESPRKLIFRAPMDAGSLPIEVFEAGRQLARGTFVNGVVKMSVAKMTLLKGETTTLTVNVSGLDGIGEPVPLTLENHSPDVVTMQGGNVQTVMITPQEAKAGTYQAKRTLTGIKTGGFVLRARLKPTVPNLGNKPQLPPGGYRAKDLPGCPQPTDSQGHRMLRRGSFEVIALGFKVLHETRDDLVESDGPRDEVYLLADGQQFGSSPRAHFQLRSLTYGKTPVADDPTRIESGLGSDNGGMTTGDSSVESGVTLPWTAAAGPLATQELPTHSDRFPMVLWQGELTENLDLVAIVPSLWEWDAPARTVDTQWNAGISQFLGGVSGMAPAMATANGSAMMPIWREDAAHGGDPLAALFPSRGPCIPVDKDRPIGLLNYPPALSASPALSHHARGQCEGNTRAFPLQAVLLNYQAATLASTWSSGYGQGVFALHYHEYLNNDLDGDYVLYVWIKSLALAPGQDLVPDPRSLGTATPVAGSASGGADMTVDLNGSPDPAATSDTVTFTANLRNVGSATANDAALVITVPSGATISGGNCTVSGATMTCAPGTFATTDTFAAQAYVRPGSAGTLTVTAAATASNDANTSNNNASASVTVNPAATGGADLALRLTAAPEPVTRSTTLTYTATVTNNGPDPASGVRFSDLLPGGARVVSSRASVGSCTGLSPVVCTTPTLASGASWTITIVATAPSTAGSITDNASVSATTTDPNPANNSASATSTVR